MFSIFHSVGEILGLVNTTLNTHEFHVLSVRSEALFSLMFGPSILEPDFDLSLGKVQISSQLFALTADNIAVFLEDLFESQQLPR